MNQNHPLRRIHPSKLSPLTQPCQRHHPSAMFPRHQVSPPGLPLTLLLSAPFFHFPPEPLPVLASRSVQVTSLNLRGLSRARVRCTNTPFPMYPCPLLPWAFRTPVHRCPNIVRSYPMYPLRYRTETRPDAPTILAPRQPKGRTRNTIVPTSSKHLDIC